VGDNSQHYALYESEWDNRDCPLCGHPTIGHALLYSEPSPEPPDDDTRRPVGDVFLHDGTPDCHRAFAAHSAAR